MNTGIQDAVDLGDALVAVLTEGADPAPLDGYEARAGRWRGRSSPSPTA